MLYPAECAGRPAALAVPAKQYSDFVQWQSEFLAGPDGERLWRYWEQKLAGATQVLDLPTDWPRPPVFSHRGGAVAWQLRPELVRHLKGLAADEGTTLYAALAGRISGAALPLYRPGRFSGRLPVCRPEPTGI